MAKINSKIVAHAQVKAPKGDGRRRPVGGRTLLYSAPLNKMGFTSDQWDWLKAIAGDKRTATEVVRDGVDMLLELMRSDGGDVTLKIAGLPFATARLIVPRLSILPAQAGAEVGKPVEAAPDPGKPRGRGRPPMTGGKLERNGLRPSQFTDVKIVAKVTSRNYRAVVRDAVDMLFAVIGSDGGDVALYLSGLPLAVAHRLVAQPKQDNAGA